MFEPVVIGCIIGGTISSWIVTCHTNVRRQRVRLITAAALGNVPVADIASDFGKVSHEKHWWYCVTFRNPLKLYPERLVKHYNNKVVVDILR